MKDTKKRSFGSFGYKLEAARESAGLSKDYVAMMLDVDIRTIYYWEQGYKFPNPEHLKQLVKLYKVTTDSIYF